MNNVLSSVVVFLVCLICACSICVFGVCIGLRLGEKNSEKKFKEAGVVLVETRIGDNVEYSVKNISEFNESK